MFHVANTCDGTAFSVMLLSFFQVIPWPHIAAFVSTIYFLVRLYFVIKNKRDDK